MKILEGKPLAEALIESVAERVRSLEKAPGIAAVLVGDDEASRVYVELKKKAAKKCGIEFYDYFLRSESTTDEIVAVVDHLNGDEDIDGILVQLPLPSHIDKERVLEAINPEKDVDGLTSSNARCSLERGECYICPFPRAIVYMIKSAKEDLSGRHGMVIGNSRIFGEVVSGMLAPLGIESVTYLFREDTWRKDIKSADIIVSAVGRAGYLNGEMFRDDAIVIDGGIERVGGQVKGDVDIDSCRDRNISISPVPGGVGPVTVACLMDNVAQASEKAKNRK